jgi:hypothetical protein
MNIFGKVSTTLAVLALCACGGVSEDPLGGGAASGSDAGTGHGSTGGSSSGGGGSPIDGATSRVPTNHRASNAQCTAPAPAGDCSGPGPTPGGCTTDGACTSGKDGRCISPGGGPASDCVCTYDTCTLDTDCHTGETCACHGAPYTDGAGSTCVPGNCRVDSDCGTDGYCSPSSKTAVCGDSLAGYYCHTAKDECTNDSDCPSSTTTAGVPMCVYSTTDTRWACVAVPVCV